MDIKFVNETKVLTILSGYIRELREGKDYLKTTYKTAETIDKIYSVEKTKSLIDFLYWYRQTEFNCEGYPPEDVINEYLKTN